jgi:hypothetical protein
MTVYGCPQSETSGLTDEMRTWGTEVTVKEASLVEE